MLRKKLQFWHSVAFLLDCAVLCGAWLLAYAFRFDTGLLPLRYARPDLAQYLPALWLIPLAWLLPFRWMGLYRTRRIGTRLNEKVRLVQAAGLSTLVLVAACYLVFKLPLSRLFLACFWVIASGGLILLRALFRELLRFARRRGWNTRRALILGTGELGRAIHERLRAHPELGMQLVGYVAADAAQVGGDVEGVPVLGALEDLRELVRREDVSELFIAQSPEVQRELDRVLVALAEEMLNVSLVSDLYKHSLLGGRVEDFEGMPVLAVSSSPMIGWGYVVKRVFDVGLSAALLLLGAPFLLLTALLVKLSSPGPVFYRQDRMGLDGKSFTLYKFRTMRADAEKSGPQWSQREDPRRTAIGAVLRRLSIDELPQLWNVLHGEMSLVGPRPERPVFVEEFREKIPRYMLRHRVKAGLTGWAQIHGLRGDTPVEERLQYDLFYIRNWSLALDLRILWRTLCGGFVDKNA